MKLVYLSLMNLEDRKNFGVRKKVEGQVKAFEKKFAGCYLAYIKNDGMYIKDGKNEKKISDSKWKKYKEYEKRFRYFNKILEFIDDNRIDNLSEFVKQLIDNRSSGLFFPQNAEYVNTSEMVRLIAEAHGKKIVMTKLFNPLLKLLNVSTVNKVFGDLVYEMSMSKFESDYRVCGFRESIKKTEQRN